MSGVLVTRPAGGSPMPTRRTTEATWWLKAISAPHTNLCTVVGRASLPRQCMRERVKVWAVR